MSASRKRKRRSLWAVLPLTCALWLSVADEPEAQGQPGAAQIASSSAAARVPRPVRLVRIDGMISPATADVIAEATRQAGEDHAAALLIELDTPGGLVDSTREIVKTMLNARLPIIVYVTPRGARAASAGLFITMAGHVAAMAPGTNIGAAHPIGIGGPERSPSPHDHKDDDEDRPSQNKSTKNAPSGKAEPGAPNKSGSGKDTQDVSETNEKPALPYRFHYRSDHEHLARKVENDTIAWAIAIANERGRNADWAARAVRDSVSITAEEALAKKVIDLVVSDRGALFKAVEGRTIRTPADSIVLHIDGAPIVEHTWTVKQRVLAFLANPTLLGVLSLLMLAGFWMEVSHPGLIFPAVIGGLALLGLLVGMQAIPVNALGLVLIATGFVLFFLEVKIVSYGLLTLGGVAAIVGGFFLLVDRAQFTFPAIDWYLIAPALGAVVLLVAFVTLVGARAQNTVAYGGENELLGQQGDAQSPISASELGKVFVLGTLWTAWSDVPIDKGARIRVVAVDGLRLKVEPLSLQKSTS